MESLPDNYILDRWRKDYKRIHVLESSRSDFAGTASMACTWDERYDLISLRCSKLAELCCTSDKKYNRALEVIRRLQEELAQTDDEVEGDDPTGASPNGSVLKDPCHVNRVGRPRTRRMRGAVEKMQKARGKGAVQPKGKGMQANESAEKVKKRGRPVGSVGRGKNVVGQSSRSWAANLGNLQTPQPSNGQVQVLFHDPADATPTPWTFSTQQFMDGPLQALLRKFSTN